MAVAMYLSFPHPVPRIIIPFVVVERSIVEGAGCVEGEIKPADLVMIGIEIAEKHVGIPVSVAAAEAHYHRIRSGVDATRADIERGIVIRHMDGRGLCRGGTLHG